MSDKDVSIRFGLSAEGTEEVVKDLQEVKQEAENAAESVGKATSGSQTSNPDNPIAMPDSAMSKGNSADDQAKGIIEVIDLTKKKTEATKDMDDANEKAIQSEKELAEAFRQAADKAEAAAKAEKKHDESVKDLSTSIKGLALMQLAEGFSHVADEMVDATKKGGLLENQSDTLKTSLKATAGGASMLATGLSAAVATGNPVIGLFAGIVQGARRAVDSYKEMKEAQQEALVSQQNALVMQQRLAQFVVETNNRIKTESNAAFWEREAAALERQAAAAERTFHAKQDASRIQMQIADESVRTTKLSGGNVDASQENAIVTKINLTLDGLKAELEDAQRKADDAAQSQKDAEHSYDQIARNNLSTQSQIDEANSKIEQTKKEAEATSQNLESLKAIFPEKITANIQPLINDLIESQQKAFSDKAKQIESGADSLAPANDAIAAGVNSIKQATADGVLTAQELNQVGQEAQQLKNANSTATREAQQQVNEMQSDLNKNNAADLIKDVLKDYKSTSKVQDAAVQQLQDAVSDGKLTQEEIKKSAAALAIMNTNLNEVWTQQNSTLDQILNMVSWMKSEQLRQAEVIKGLQAKR